MSKVKAVCDKWSENKINRNYKHVDIVNKQKQREKKLVLAMCRSDKDMWIYM
jgi:hypothetical protein